MRFLIVALAMLAGISSAHAADVAAGKAKVEQVCAACHGANGISVSATIPNLAGQKPGYLNAQLKAFKSGTRKNQIMGPIARNSIPRRSTTSPHSSRASPVRRPGRRIPNSCRTSPRPT